MSLRRAAGVRWIAVGNCHLEIWMKTLGARLLAIALSAIPASVGVAASEDGFTLFESGQVRPLALSADGSTLFAANTPDNRLEVFRVTDTGLVHDRSFAVGLEPVALAVRNEREVWVVNHLSDSISIVDLAGNGVVRTLLVGDEPRDIVFAGPSRSRAFITTAHRGQASPWTDPANPGQATTPGVGRADVWVFDAAAARDASLGGTPLAVLTFFTDTPRALAASADGSRVYVAGFHTGNRTTAIFESLVTDAGGLPGPRVDAAGEVQPETGLIVRFDGEHWVDELGRIFDDQVRFSLPDRDVFAIDALANPPAPFTGPAGTFAGVGTVLFNMVVNPTSGRVYVANTDARNSVRFEGSGARGTTVRGHLVESRITVLNPDGTIAPRHLNKHIDYSQCCAAVPNDENARSLAFPTDMAITRDGRQLYVAAFGSSKIGVFDTRALETNRFAPDRSRQIEVSGGGPSGLALDEARTRLYALTRFDNSVVTIDTATKQQIAAIAMHNPEPASVVTGRRFLYDASLSSSHGDSACASCHVFGDLDSLAWDLGNPDEVTLRNPGPFTVGGGRRGDFRALKGPMTTQSFRGMANHGPLHWRGDRTGGNDAATAQPDRGSFDEDAAFKKFSGAFVSLNGRDVPLEDAQMQAFADFVLQLTYPPNPIRNLDNSLTPAQQAGRNFYFGAPSDGALNCNGCHRLDPAGNAEFSVAKPGWFGTEGRSSFENEPQIFKIPHLRNMYQKVGMFGMAEVGDFYVPGENETKGDQIRGFGFLHDGSTDTLFRFHGATALAQSRNNPGGFPRTPEGVIQRRNMEQFMLAFDSNLAPVVGQQVTLSASTEASATPRIALLMQRAQAAECELVVHAGEQGFLFIGNGQFAADTATAPAVPAGELALRARQPGSAQTYTCVPAGSGTRLALDRDSDGFLDGDERAAGSNPADPRSTPPPIR